LPLGELDAAGDGDATAIADGEADGDGTVCVGGPAEPPPPLHAASIDIATSTGTILRNIAVLNIYRAADTLSRRTKRPGEVGSFPRRSRAFNVLFT
jgi:hypothetical protein